MFLHFKFALTVVSLKLICSLVTKINDHEASLSMMTEIFDNVDIVVVIVIYNVSRQHFPKNDGIFPLFFRDFHLLNDKLKKGITCWI